jgi:CheY-like chemotaxis protein
VIQDSAALWQLQISTHFIRKPPRQDRSSEKERRLVMDNRMTIFYVDDNPKSSQLLTSVLEECGFRVITNNDPLEALALCRRTYFDLALIDYEMPTMSGARLAQEIKFLVPDVPVVLLSARSTLPKSELAFVDAHFGFGTSLDDLLWTMRILVQPVLVQPKVAVLANHLPAQREMTRWADST